MGFVPGRREHGSITLPTRVRDGAADSIVPTPSASSGRALENREGWGNQLYVSYEKENIGWASPRFTVNVIWSICI
jgi:hypothetical protein